VTSTPFPYAAVSGAAEELLERCLAALGPIPEAARLGFVYLSDAATPQLQEIVAGLREAAPAVSWVGGVGLAVCATGREYYDEPALVVMLAELSPRHFRLLPNLRGELSTLPEQLRRWLFERDYCFGLLHGDPTNPATPGLIDTIATALPASFLNGGLSSGEALNRQIADEVVSGGVSGVLFDSTVEVVTDHTQGCTPLGPKHRLTGFERNVALTLDERPALEVLKEDIGEVLARDLQRIGGYVFAALPIAGSDTGDYLVRNLVALDTRQGLVAIGEHLEGQDQLMFCRRDGNSARVDMAQMLERLVERVGGRPIRGGVYVSCLGRGRSQFGDDSAELRAIAEHLGEFPLVGFFANGELYNGRLYGYTGVLTLFL